MGWQQRPNRSRALHGVNPAVVKLCRLAASLQCIVVAHAATTHTFADLRVTICVRLLETSDEPRLRRLLHTVPCNEFLYTIALKYNLIDLFYFTDNVNMQKYAHKSWSNKKSSVVKR